jgi:hypothetical protein
MGDTEPPQYIGSASQIGSRVSPTVWLLNEAASGREMPDRVNLRRGP